jgi:poly(beta-D-mannuronate) C5 epimerase
MYYGFYSFEADDVVIVGNKYANNVVYGIDPHDRSRRLIIAHNEAYGSQMRHGIIISREVNDSWIFDNYSHDNNESGIVVDRKSVHNVIANNTTAFNQRDGITLFESQANLIVNNLVHHNHSCGVRVRNSWDISVINNQIMDNQDAPIIVYTSPLETKEPERDFKLDPYQQRAEALIHGGYIRSRDGKPNFKIDGADKVTLANVQLLADGPLFADNLLYDDQSLIPKLETPDYAIVVSKRAQQTAYIQTASRMQP